MRRHSIFALAAVMSLGCAAASAQVYRCSNGGSTYLSDRPCAAATPTPSPGSRATLGAIGPLPQHPVVTYEARSSLPKAPDHLAYLSPACASLNDAIRTGPSRGLRYGAMADLHNEYRAKCADEEAEAYQKLSRDRNDQRVARRQEVTMQQAEQQRSVREREQCSELLRILHGKRQRVAAMNDGERADLERSEAAYRARCDAR